MIMVMINDNKNRSMIIINDNKNRSMIMIIKIYDND